MDDSFGHSFPVTAFLKLTVIRERNYLLLPEPNLILKSGFYFTEIIISMQFFILYGVGPQHLQ